MIILNPLEPWPGELVPGAAAGTKSSLIARVVDHGGLFHDDVLPGHVFAEHDHRKFRPAGWPEQAGRAARSDASLRRAHDMTMLQLACAWDLGTTPSAASRRR